MIINRECVTPHKYYPPVNYELLNGQYILRVSVAGYNIDMIRLYMDGNRLIISSESNEYTGTEYIYKGIGARAFKYIFLMDGLARIVSTSILNGILTITMDYNIQSGIIRLPLNSISQKD